MSLRSIPQLPTGCHRVHPALHAENDATGENNHGNNQSDIGNDLSVAYPLPQSTATLQLREIVPQARSQPPEAQGAHPPCPELAKTPRILDRFIQTIGKCGVVGEDRAAQLVYLVVTSRVLERPVSTVLRGPSGVGKNFIPQQTLRFFPSSAYYSLSAMSERALAYSNEPLSHRILMIYESAGVSGDLATYLLRSLLSEGRVRYETVESTKDGLRPKLIEREGPTGLLLTTTAVRLHPENETRMLSIPISDSPQQTQRVLEALAVESDEQLDLSEWVAFQEWLEKAEHRVTIPYAKALARSIQPVAVRLRRDFKTVLSLIKTHAIIHQVTREKDADGRIIASLEDYAVIRDLVEDLLAEGVDRSVPLMIRETVRAVTDIIASKQPREWWATVTEVAALLRIDKSSASRRIKGALARGFLDNLEQGKGRPYRLVLGERLPDEHELLPRAEVLEVLHGCNVNGGVGG